HRTRLVLRGPGHARAGDADRREHPARAHCAARHRSGAAGASKGMTMPVPLVTNILLADDHPLFRQGLRQVLEREPDLRVVAEASDGAEAVERALADEVHLVLLDVSMPRMTGLQAAREITKRDPEIRVLMLSMHDNERYFFEALEAGASGYVLKTAADRDVVNACRAAMRGEPFL